MSRLFFLRNLRSINVCSKTKEIFHHSVVVSTVYFIVVCWGSSITAGDTNRLTELIRKAL